MSPVKRGTVPHVDDATASMRNERHGHRVSCDLSPKRNVALPKLALCRPELIRARQVIDIRRARIRGGTSTPAPPALACYEENSQLCSPLLLQLQSWTLSPLVPQ
jgi:hypothetical protein